MLIVTIDGGGMLGYLPARVLTALEISTGKPLALTAGMFAGTSTGAILALGLAAGIPPEELARFYVDMGARIFKGSLLRRVAAMFGFVSGEYSNKGLHEGLVKVFGDKRLSDVLTPCMAVAYDIESRQAVFFTSWEAAKNPDRNYLLVDVAMASAAAPTYFTPWLAKSCRSSALPCIDGGVAANNPSLCAVVEAIKQGHDIGSLRLISLGTGRMDRPYLLRKARKWGLVDWVRPLIDILFSASSDVADHQCRNILGDRYVRLQQNVSGDLHMDDTGTDLFAILDMAACQLEETSDMRIAIEMAGTE